MKDFFFAFCLLFVILKIGTTFLCGLKIELENIAKDVKIDQFVQTLKNALKIDNGTKIDDFNMNKMILEEDKNQLSFEKDCRSKNNGVCCRDSLKINFKELGFTNILYPLEIDIGFCNGHCKDFTIFSNHAKLLLLSKNDTPGRSICCHPDIYKNTYIYLKKKDIIYVKLIDTFVVKTCQCA